MSGLSMTVDGRPRTLRHRRGHRGVYPPETTGSHRRLEITVAHYTVSTPLRGHGEQRLNER